MAERNYWVMCDDNCRFPAMTKEQILTAIEQAISTGSIQDVDTGFVTTIKEQNKQTALRFWVGTQAEYKRLDEESRQNLFAIITDDDTKTVMNQTIEQLSKNVESIDKVVTKNFLSLMVGSIEVAQAKKARMLKRTVSVATRYTGEGSIVLPLERGATYIFSAHSELWGSKWITFVLDIPALSGTVATAVQVASSAHAHKGLDGSLELYTLEGTVSETSATLDFYVLSQGTTGTASKIVVGLDVTCRYYKLNLGE